MQSRTVVVEFSADTFVRAVGRLIGRSLPGKTDVVDTALIDVPRGQPSFRDVEAQELYTAFMRRDEIGSVEAHDTYLLVTAAMTLKGKKEIARFKGTVLDVLQQFPELNVTVK